jgi:hypothetical protein
VFVLVVVATDLRRFVMVATDLSCIDGGGGGHGSEMRGVV